MHQPLFTCSPRLPLICDRSDLECGRRMRQRNDQSKSRRITKRIWILRTHELSSSEGNWTRKLKVTNSSCCHSLGGRGNIKYFKDCIEKRDVEHSSYIDFPQPFQKIGFSESIRQKLYNSNPLFLDANIAVARVCHPVRRDLDVDDAWNRCGTQWLYEARTWH